MHQALARHFGFREFLDGQEDVVGRILDGDDLCVIMPTGAGKSLCYQLPALMRDGYTLVVSPLISLMKDQVDALAARGIPAACINSTLAPAAREDAMRAAAMGELKLLYVAPERFRAPSFERLLRTAPPQTVVVDEAHCISQWGHDFRPDYLRIGPAVGELDGVQVCAFTATATVLVRDDIRRALGRPEMDVYVTGFRRPNLAFSVVDCRSDADKDAVVGRLLGENVPTIIYAATRKDVDRLVASFGCIGYHAGMPDAERESAQNRFMSEPVPVLAATNAFGMGIDRPDIRKVIHFSMPGSLEAYYQEAGRAGRDGEPADCVLLFSYRDRYLHEFLLELNNPPEVLLRSLYDLLRREALKRPGEPLNLSIASLAERLADARSEQQVSAALRVLDRHGCIRRGYRQENAGVLRIDGDLDSLRVAHEPEATQRSRFLHRVIRTYGDPLLTGIRVTPDRLATVTGLGHERTQRVLRALNGQVLSWEPPFAGRTVLVPEPEKTAPDMDFAALRSKHEFELQRLEGVIDYARSRTCRQDVLVGYFGQDVGAWRCGRCDQCSAETRTVRRVANPEEREAIVAVLETVQSLKGRFGRGTVARILAGSRERAILERGLDRHPHYGEYETLGTTGLFRLLDALERAGALTQAGDSRYPTVAITAVGRNIRAGAIAAELDFPESEARIPSAVKKSRRPEKLEAAATAADGPLFDRLRQVRAEIAAEARVAPFRVFSNSTLRSLAALRPTTPEEALQIKGVGQIKAETVLGPFLEAIREAAEDD